MRRVLVVVIVIAAAALAGCEVGKMIKEGDALLEVNRGVEAAASYEHALAKDPKLARKPDFMTKLNQAQALGAYQQGVQLGRQGEWEAAVEAFKRSIGVGPEVADAPRALAEARREAAKVCHQRALGLADKGQLNPAILELRRALEFDPENLDAKDALESVERRKGEGLSRAQRLYEEAGELHRERRWQAAAAKLDEAVATDANHVPARVARHQSNAKMAEARTHREEALRLMKDRRLDEALAAYAALLEVWPFFPEADSELAEVRRQRATAQEHFDRARGHAERGEWDDAFRAAHAALGVYPHLADAKALLEQSRQEAAAGHLRRGNALLTDGQLDKAEAEFQQALGFVADLLAAKEGLALADTARGDAAREQGFWGTALLWYMGAVDDIDLPRYREKVGEARAAVHKRLRFTMSLAREQIAADPSSGELLNRTLADLSATRPPFLELVNAGAGAAPMYAATIALTRCDIGQRLIDTQSRSHPYTVAVAVANPEIPRLHARLVQEQQELAQLIRRSHERCTWCHGSGRSSCGRCGGDGIKDGARCRECRGTGRVPCTWCDGTGHRSSVSEWQIRRQRDEIDGLAGQLAGQPPTVTVHQPAEWPYTVETYEKTGAMLAGLRLVEAAGAAVVVGETVRAEARNTDTVRRNANPGIGLRHDGLDLPTDSAVRDALLKSTAEQAAGRLIVLALQAQVARAQGRARTLQEAGREAEAVEAYVDAALLAEPIDSAETLRVLNQLRQPK